MRNHKKTMLSLSDATKRSTIRIPTDRTWAVVVASLGLMGCLGSEDITENSLVPESSPVVAGNEEATMRDAFGTALSPISAAIARANAQADLDLNLLVRVEIQAGEMLEIYEPTPGALLVSSAGAPAGKAILSEEAVSSMAIEDVWKLATNSAEMPGELRAALARSNQRQPQGGRTILQGSARKAEGAPSRTLGNVVSKGTAAPTALTSGWCDTGYFTSGYGNCPSGYDFSVCVNDWTGGAYGSYGGAEYVYTNVCPATGSVVLHVQSDWGGGGYWTVPQNTVREWAQSLWGCFFDCLDVRSDVEQASGDRFHFRFLALD
jgi:hypothetical protein